jgi:hypothetical protein
MQELEIETVRIPKNFENIGTYCFFGCQSLCGTTLESPCQLKEIGNLAFCYGEWTG